MELIKANTTELILLVFLVITFLQSGLDKISDWNGNVGWLKGHFEKTPFKNIVPLLLVVILLMEVLTGVLSILGIYTIITSGTTYYAFFGAVLGCISLLMLLLGQRVAKDYDGARTIVIYLIPTVFLVFLLQN